MHSIVIDLASLTPMRARMTVQFVGSVIIAHVSTPSLCMPVNAMFVDGCVVVGCSTVTFGGQRYLWDEIDSIRRFTWFVLWNPNRFTNAGSSVQESGNHMDSGLRKECVHIFRRRPCWPIRLFLLNPCSKCRLTFMTCLGPGIPSETVS